MGAGDPLRRVRTQAPAKWGGEGLRPTAVGPQLLSCWLLATVPVLGCSSPEESYPSLANQPSSGAKQGNVRWAVREGSASRPMLGLSGSSAAWPPWPPRPASALGSPRLLAGSWL